LRQRSKLARSLWNLRMLDPKLDGGPVSIRRLRCPRCGAAPTSLIEHVTVYTTFQCEDGARCAEGDHSEGDITMVRAVCACDHRWRLRGVTQITDLDLTK
jgi:hypothetical protein